MLSKEIIQFKAKDYLNRQDLELAIKAEVGFDTNTNREVGHTIIGTREEMKVLYLSDAVLVYGVFCIISDKPTKTKLKNKLKKYGVSKKG